VGRILVGTSGYVYRHWRELFYAGVPAARWLSHYAAAFPTVELNATFYRLPSVEAVRNWRRQTPAGFVFACKGSRYLTHNKKLGDPAASLERFFDRVRHLGDKLGPVVWQLPPQLKRADLGRLERFLALLPRDPRHAVEFRSAAWYSEETCALLDRFGVAFCEHDLVAVRPPRPTGGFRYVRFHGHGAKYAGRYGREGLAGAAASLARWRDAGRDAYVYFNNDVGGHALLDAFDLADLLTGREDRPTPVSASGTAAAPWRESRREVGPGLAARAGRPPGGTTMERRNPDIERPTGGGGNPDIEQPPIDRERAQRDEDERIKEQIPSSPERAEEGPDRLSDLVGEPVAHDPTSEGTRRP
jgi:uncharacterized protein YecE (DUF72 family)